MGKKNFGFYIKEYLTFSRSQRNGILILFFILLILMIIKVLIPKLLPQKSPVNIYDFKNEISSFEKSDSVSNSKPDLANNDVIHYYPKTNSNQLKKIKFKKIDINTSDTITLVQLPGIGSIFAQRIIKYRQLLGGFYTLTQLNEVYGLKPESVKNLEKFLIVDTLKINKIDINTSEFKKINAHPYISYEQTKAIFRVRSGQKIKSLEELKEKEIFSNAELNRIRPYLLIN